MDKETVLVRLFVSILILIIFTTGAGAVDFFSTAYLETYRIDLNNYMVSPNLYFKLGRFEGYGFIDRYLEGEEFYHGELMFAFQPLTMKPLDRISIIAERRWDKYAPSENSFGLRFRIW